MTRREQTDPSGPVWTFGQTPDGWAYHLIPKHTDRLPVNSVDERIAAACGETCDHWNTRGNPSEPRQLCGLCVQTGWVDMADIPAPVTPDWLQEKQQHTDHD